MVTEEEEVRCRLTDELDERFLDEAALLRVWSHDVEHGMDRELTGYTCSLNKLTHHGLTPEAGQTLVPDGAQQLLHVWMCHKLTKYGIFILDLTS